MRRAEVQLIDEAHTRFGGDERGEKRGRARPIASEGEAISRVHCKRGHFRPPRVALLQLHTPHLRDHSAWGKRVILRVGRGGREVGTERFEMGGWGTGT